MKRNIYHRCFWIHCLFSLILRFAYFVFIPICAELWIVKIEYRQTKLAIQKKMCMTLTNILALYQICRLFPSLSIVYTSSTAKSAHRFEKYLNRHFFLLRIKWKKAMSLTYGEPNQRWSHTNPHIHHIKSKCRFSAPFFAQFYSICLHQKCKLHIKVE